MTLQELLGDAFKEGITTEEITAALTGKTLVDPATGYVKKSVFDTTASDLAALKKQLKEKQTDEEKQAELLNQQKEQFEALKRENAINKYEKLYLGKGFTAERSTIIAEALAEGKFEVVADETAKHTTELINTAKADAMKDTKAPGAGSGTGGKDSSWGASAAIEQLKARGIQTKQ